MHICLNNKNMDILIVGFKVNWKRNQEKVPNVSRGEWDFCQLKKKVPPRFLATLFGRYLGKLHVLEFQLFVVFWYKGWFSIDWYWIRRFFFWLCDQLNSAFLNFLLPAFRHVNACHVMWNMSWFVGNTWWLFLAFLGEGECVFFLR